jgi:hypothetical protein
MVYLFVNCQRTVCHVQDLRCCRAETRCKLCESMLVRLAITTLSILHTAFKRGNLTALALHAHCNERREALELTGGCSATAAMSAGPGAVAPGTHCAPAFDSPAHICAVFESFTPSKNELSVYQSNGLQATCRVSNNLLLLEACRKSLRAVRVRLKPSSSSHAANNKWACIIKKVRNIRCW